MGKKRPARRASYIPPVAAKTPRAEVLEDVVVSLSGYGDVLDEVSGYAADRRELDALIAESIRAARSAGHTWTALGRALGVSPQAVQKRYGTPRD